MSHIAIQKLIKFLDEEVVRLDKYDLLIVKQHLTKKVALATVALSYRATVAGERSLTIELQDNISVVVGLPTIAEKEAMAVRAANGLKLIP